MKIQKGNWWEKTSIKTSVVLKGFAEFMNDPKVKDKRTPYDNRHLRMKPQ
jgi:hypothetical protein